MPWSDDYQSYLLDDEEKELARQAQEEERRQEEERKMYEDALSTPSGTVEEEREGTLSELQGQGAPAIDVTPPDLGTVPKEATANAVSERSQAPKNPPDRAVTAPRVQIDIDGSQSYDTIEAQTQSQPQTQAQMQGEALGTPASDITPVNLGMSGLSRPEGQYQYPVEAPSTPARQRVQPMTPEEAKAKNSWWDNLTNPEGAAMRYASRYNKAYVEPQDVHQERTVNRETKLINNARTLTREARTNPVAAVGARRAMELLEIPKDEQNGILKSTAEQQDEVFAIRMGVADGSIKSLTKEQIAKASQGDPEAQEAFIKAVGELRQRELDAAERTRLLGPTGAAPAPISPAPVVQEPPVTLTPVPAQVVTPRAENTQSVQATVVQKAREVGVNPRLAHAVIGNEGSGSQAVSPKGAIGNFQMMPATALKYLPPGATEAEAKELLKDTSINHNVGLQHLKDLETQFPGRPDLQLAAYFSGAGNVDAKAGRIINPNRHDGNMTVAQYVQKGMARYHAAPQSEAQPQAQPQAQQTASTTSSDVSLTRGAQARIDGLNRSLAPINAEIERYKKEVVLQKTPGGKEAAKALLTSKEKERDNILKVVNDIEKESREREGKTQERALMREEDLLKPADTKLVEQVNFAIQTQKDKGVAGAGEVEELTPGLATVGDVQKVLKEKKMKPLKDDMSRGGEKSDEEFFKASVQSAQMLNDVVALLPQVKTGKITDQARNKLAEYGIRDLTTAETELKQLLMQSMMQGRKAITGSAFSAQEGRDFNSTVPLPEDPIDVLVTKAKTLERLTQKEHETKVKTLDSRNIYVPGDFRNRPQVKFPTTKELEQQQNEPADIPSIQPLIESPEYQKASKAERGKMIDKYIADLPPEGQRRAQDLSLKEKILGISLGVGENIFGPLVAYKLIQSFLKK